GFRVRSHIAQTREPLEFSERHRCAAPRLCGYSCTRSGAAGQGWHQPGEERTSDAEAICEAVTRPTMRFVPIKEVEQQDLQAFHRTRARVVKARTALVNEIQGLLAEYGIVLPQSVTKFRHTLF